MLIYYQISVVFMVGLLVTSWYVIWNLTKKTELLETWVEDFTQTIETINRELKEIDAKGSFESDDETGAIFKQIQDTIKQLDSYKGEEE
jgi:hypothetical protein|tara:strand:+ start:1384 stop:1650 length:267 start_codon:yes stop_codon:yes gene_type:complete